MERHIESCLNKVSTFCIVIATILLIFLFLQTPKTCIPPHTPITKPHLKFPSSTCDSSLLHPYVPLSKKNQKLWSSRSFLSRVSSFQSLFQDLRSLHLLRNHSNVLCVAAGAGHSVMALHNIGVCDVTAVELVDSLPFVRRADPHNLPFFDDVFDLAFTQHMDLALFPLRFAEEMERTVRKGGACVVMVDECSGSELDEIVGLFKRSKLVGSTNISFTGAKVTRIVMSVDVSSS